jgi:hypothetical protein
MRLCVYNMIDDGRRGQKPGYIYEMGSHDLKSCEVKCQRNIRAKCSRTYGCIAISKDIVILSIVMRRFYCNRKRSERRVVM